MVVGCRVFANEPVKKITVNFLSVFSPSQREKANLLFPMIRLWNRNGFLVNDCPALSNQADLRAMDTISLSTAQHDFASDFRRRCSNIPLFGKLSVLRQKLLFRFGDRAVKADIAS